MLRHQWEALNDRIEGAAESHAFENLKNAADGVSADHKGMIFSDSDLAKWLEAAAYALAEAPDEGLASLVEEVADTYVRAQRDDGYLNSYYQLNFPEKRWTNLQLDHELYCIGHFIEAAVAYEQATGSSKLTEVATRAVDAVRSALGPDPGKIRGYPGHEEIELALVKLARLTGEPRHLELARYFINERGTRPNFFADEAIKRNGRPVSEEDAPPSELHSKASYNQSHLPVREQSEAVGHSVRAMYLYTAMADLAAIDSDSELAAACRRLWESTTKRRMYITGGIGSTRTGEAFTYDYDLPGDVAYAETCAAIGLVFFARRMIELEPLGEYGDVMERALYNAVLSGVSLDGKGYFYVNPLIVSPTAAAKKPETVRARTQREPWKLCACCPPNVARLVTSFQEYAWSTRDDTLFAHLYHAGSVTVEATSARITFLVQTDYPWDGDIDIDVSISGGDSAETTLALRIPDWCDNPTLRINEEGVPMSDVVTDGYAYLARTWEGGDTLRLRLPMTPRRVRAAPQIVDAMGKVALQRGPLIYCLEEIDNGVDLMTRALPRSADVTSTTLKWDDALPGAVALRAAGKRLLPARLRQTQRDHPTEPLLYTYDAEPPSEDVELTFVPYFAWANRTPGEMIVWLREI